MSTRLSTAEGRSEQEPYGIHRPVSLVRGHLEHIGQTQPALAAERTAFMRQHLPIIGEQGFDGEFKNLPDAEQERVATQRLRETLLWATTYSPFYIQKLGLTPEQIATMTAADLPNLPVVTREELAAHSGPNNDMLTAGSDGLVVHTSGWTTGEGKFCWRTPQEIATYQRGVGDWFRGEMPDGTKILNLINAGGLWGGSRDEGEAVTEHTGTFQHLPVYGNASLSRLVQVWKTFQPDAIFAMPDNVLKLARAIDSMNREGAVPEALMDELVQMNLDEIHAAATRGDLPESLLSVAFGDLVKTATRERILEELRGVNLSDLSKIKYMVYGGAPLSEAGKAELDRLIGVEGGIQYISYYSGSEPQSMGYQLREHMGDPRIPHHLANDHVQVWIRDPETGEKVPDGEVGEIVVTVMHMFSQPMINFATGDAGRILPHEGNCPCGIHTPLLTLEGRTDDFIQLGNAKFPGDGVMKLVTPQVTELTGARPTGIWKMVWNGEDTTGKDTTVNIRIEADVPEPQDASEQLRASVLSAIDEYGRAVWGSMGPMDLHISVQLVPTGSIETNSQTGKVRHVEDDRGKRGAHLRRSTAAN